MNIDVGRDFAGLTLHMYFSIILLIFAFSFLSLQKLFHSSRDLSWDTNFFTTSKMGEQSNGRHTEAVSVGKCFSHVRNFLHVP